MLVEYALVVRFADQKLLKILVKGKI